MLILKGHLSPETAYTVDDYPYGYTLRCKIRYWLDYSPRHGVRFMAQTTNPKRPGEAWNKPKASTYCKFGGCLFLDEQKHVAWTGLTEYCDGAEAKAWADTYREGCPPDALAQLDRWVAMKLAYDANRSKGDPLHVGVAEAVKAGQLFSEATTRELIDAQANKRHGGNEPCDAGLFSSDSLQSDLVEEAKKEPGIPMRNMHDFDKL